MLESLLPWTTTGIYMLRVLGISATEYWKFQFLSLYGFAIAILLAITGIGCFYKEKTSIREEKRNVVNSGG